MEMETPKGKRSLRVTVRGSVMGYIGKTSWECFGERGDPAAEARANEWVKSAD